MGLFCAETGGIQCLTPVIFPRCFFQSAHLYAPYLRIDINDIKAERQTSIIRFAVRNSNHLDISLLLKEELLYCTLLSKEYIEHYIQYTIGGGFVRKVGNHLTIEKESEVFKKEEQREHTIALLKRSMLKPRVTIALGDNLLQ